jgi:hypothetical protein
MTRIQSEVRANNPKVKLPPIRLIYASLQKDNLRTKAYAIEFAQDDAQSALRILKDIYAGTKHFLLARMRHTNPDAYCKALKMQNQHVSLAYVIPLMNIPEAAMFYLHERLLAIEGVKDVVPTQHTESAGRYNILIAKEHFKNAKKWLTTSFKERCMQYESLSNPRRLNFMATLASVAVVLALMKIHSETNLSFR